MLGLALAGCARPAPPRVPTRLVERLPEWPFGDHVAIVELTAVLEVEGWAAGHEFGTLRIDHEMVVRIGRARPVYDYYRAWFAAEGWQPVGIAQPRHGMVFAWRNGAAFVALLWPIAGGGGVRPAALLVNAATGNRDIR